MADADFSNSAVKGRDIRLTDLLLGLDPGESDAAVAARADTLTELITRIFQNPPATLTADQQAALRTLIAVENVRAHTVAAESQFASLRSSTPPVNILVADRDLTITASASVTEPGGTQITAVSNGDVFIWDRQVQPNGRWERWGNFMGGTGTLTLTDDAVLDLAQTTRAAADRGKALGTSAGNENALDLLDIPVAAREFARTNPVIFSGDQNANITPSDTNNGRIWNYTGTDTPTLTFANPAASIGNWRAGVVHAGTSGTVTVIAPAGTTLATLQPGESGVIIFTTTNNWQWVFFGKNPTSVTQDEAEAGTVTELRLWTPQRVKQAIDSLAPLTLSGTSDPSTGDEGDMFLQVNASNVLQSVWLRGASAWQEFTLPSGGGGSVTFGSGAGEVSEIAEGNNTDVWPFSKLPVGLDQTEVEVRLTWNNKTSWTAAGVVVSETGTSIDIPDAGTGATQLEFLVRVDASSEVRDILINGSESEGSQVFTTAPVVFTLDGVNYQHYTSATLDAATIATVEASTLEVRLTANSHDQHIEYLVEEYLTESPVLEGLTLSNAALKTLNSAGQEVSLTWPSALTQSGGSGDAQVDALHAVGISDHNTGSLINGVDNPANAFDDSVSTSVTFSTTGNKVALQGRVARVIYGGRVSINVTAPASGSVTFSLQFINGSTSRGTITTGALGTGEHGFNAPLNTWNTLLITATAFQNGAHTVSEVRVLDSNSALPGASNADLAAETTAREAGDSALSTRIDGLVTTPSADETLLDLVASTYPRDIVFTLGTRIPGGSDPGYNAGTHSLNAAGSFSETGIPTDIVALYRVTESETIGGVQLQNRLIVGVDEEGGSRRYEGEAIRWGGQLVTLTYFQRSLNNFNEYYSDVVTTLSTAGQTVALNVEDVQAEARDTIPYRRWIWHHSVATTTEHISNADFTEDTASQTLAPTQHAVAEFVPDIPDAPAHTSAATRYELNVPATSGAPTWEEPQDAVGGTGTGHLLKLPALVSGNVSITNVNLWATDANTPDLTLAESYDDDVVWGVSPGVQNEVHNGVAFFRPKDLLAVTPAVYGETSLAAQRLSFTFNHNTTVFFLHLGLTSARKLLVATSNAANDPTPLTIWETRVGGTTATRKKLRAITPSGEVYTLNANEYAIGVKLHDNAAVADNVQGYGFIEAHEDVISTNAEAWVIDTQAPQSGGHENRTVGVAISKDSTNAKQITVSLDLPNVPGTAENRITVIDAVYGISIGV